MWVGSNDRSISIPKRVFMEKYKPLKVQSPTLYNLCNEWRLLELELLHLFPFERVFNFSGFSEPAFITDPGPLWLTEEQKQPSSRTTRSHFSFISSSVNSYKITSTFWSLSLVVPSFRAWDQCCYLDRTRSDQAEQEIWCLWIKKHVCAELLWFSSLWWSSLPGLWGAININFFLQVCKQLHTRAGSPCSQRGSAGRDLLTVKMWGVEGEVGLLFFMRVSVRHDSEHYLVDKIHMERSHGEGVTSLIHS